MWQDTPVGRRTGQPVPPSLKQKVIQMLFARTPLIEIQALMGAFGRDVTQCLCRSGDESSDDLEEQGCAYGWYTTLPRPELIWPDPAPSLIEWKPGSEVRVVRDTIPVGFSGDDLRYGWELLEVFHGGSSLDTQVEFPKGGKHEVNLRFSHIIDAGVWQVTCIPFADIESSAEWYHDVLLPALGLSNDIHVVRRGKKKRYPGDSIIAESKSSVFATKFEGKMLTVKTSDREVANRWVESFLKHESDIKWAVEKQRLTVVMSFPQYQAWYPRLNAASRNWYWNIRNGTRAEMLEKGIVGDRIPLFDVDDKLLVSKVRGREGWFLEYTCHSSEKWLRTKLNRFPEIKVEFWKGAPHERWG